MRKTTPRLAATQKIRPTSADLRSLPRMSVAQRVLTQRTMGKASQKKA
jgi:hypothetical protein